MPEGAEVTLSRDFLRHEILKKTISSLHLRESGRYREGRKKPKGYDLFRGCFCSFLFFWNNVWFYGVI